MSTLSLAGCTHTVSRSDLERDQQWPDTPQNLRLLAAYGAVCERSSNCAIAALSAERGGWADVDHYKVKAAHWETVASPLGAVLSMEIDEGREEGCPRSLEVAKAEIGGWPAEGSQDLSLRWPSRKPESFIRSRMTAIGQTLRPLPALAHAVRTCENADIWRHFAPYIAARTKHMNLSDWLLKNLVEQARQTTNSETAVLLLSAALRLRHTGHPRLNSASDTLHQIPQLISHDVK